MAVSPSLLAQQMAAAIGQATVSTELTGFATGVLNELTSKGIASVGLPTGNTISGMSNSDMASKIAADAGYGSVSTELTNFCNGIVTHIQSAGIVSYIGPVPPAVPVYFLGGTISGLSGPAMAALVQADVGYPSISTELLGMCTAIATHIMTNATVTSGIIS